MKNYIKTWLKRPLKKKTKTGFQGRFLLHGDKKYCRMLQREHSAILLTFIKLQFVIKIFVLSVFEWPLKTGFTVLTFILFVLFNIHKYLTMKMTDICAEQLGQSLVPNQITHVQTR